MDRVKKRGETKTLRPYNSNFNNRSWQKICDFFIVYTMYNAITWKYPESPNENLGRDNSVLKKKKIA